MCSIFDIDEIVHVIATQLGARDLVHCLRVCRQCHVAFSPYLYRKISTLSILYHARVPAPTTTFMRYGSFIHDLTVIHPNDFLAVGNHATNLRHLKLSFQAYQAIMHDYPPYGYAPQVQASLVEYTAGDPIWTACYQSMGPILDINTKLQSLTMDTCGYDERDLPEFEKLLLQSPRLAVLASLTLVHFCYGTRNILDLLAHCRLLREITIDFEGHPAIDHQVDRFLPSYPLEMINFGHTKWNPGLALFNIMLWERCPRLASIEMTSSTAYEMAHVAHHDLGGPNSEDIDICMQWILNRLPSRTIQSFVAQHCNFSQNTLSVFLAPDRSLTLRTLCLDACNVRVPSRLIQSILASCPALETLQVGAAASTVDRTTALSAVDIANHGPWVCHGLKVLSIPIDGLQPCNDAKHARDHALCCDLERTVYRQLGQMRCLQTLCVGGDAKFAWFREANPVRLLQGTLSFTLAKGLDEMWPLLRLERLDLRDTAHAVGLAEVQWMAEHWPQWSCLRGLASASEGGTWLQQNKSGFRFF
ncbi:hypothetical protein BGZ73_001566 [Actinomortierella ambigua]|nr:hypothetical protein BGZ73_001566 [Actinomortierella ambigua]